LASLDRERSAFLDEADRGIVGHFERDTSEYVFRLSGPPPDPRIGLIVSEFGHHLRATLDNLLWQLVLVHDGGTPTNKTQFPICVSREAYKSSRARGMLDGVSTEDRALIKRLQPYHLGADLAKRHALAQLAWLNNTDKHQVLHVGCALPMIEPEDSFSEGLPWWPRIVRDIGEIKCVIPSSQTSTEDHTEIIRVGIVPTGPHPEMEMDGRLPVDISLSDREDVLTLSDLQRLRDTVHLVIDGFRPRFNI
jgi:hypothetical protein